MGLEIINLYTCDHCKKPISLPYVSEHLVQDLPPGWIAVTAEYKLPGRSDYSTHRAFYCDECGASYIQKIPPPRHKPSRQTDAS